MGSKAILGLKDIVCVYKLENFLLIETLVHSNKIKDLCYALGYDCSFLLIEMEEMVVLLSFGNILSTATLLIFLLILLISKSMTP
jgi:hypothetical protein